MKRFFIILVASFSTGALAEDPDRAGAVQKTGEKAPLMLSFADLKWTELPAGSSVHFRSANDNISGAFSPVFCTAPALSGSSANAPVEKLATRMMKNLFMVPPIGFAPSDV